LKAYPRHPVKEEVSTADILNDLRQAKVTHFFNFIYPLTKEETEGLNRFNAEFCRSTPGAIAFASLHPDTPNKADYAESLLAHDPFVGFKFHPFVQRFDPWDHRLDPLYGFLQEAGKPVILHTGFEAFYKLKMPIAQLAGLVKRYPRLPFVFVHMAFPDFPVCFELMKEFPDLYLDATNVLAFLRPEFKSMFQSLPDGNHLIDQLLAGLEVFSDRIMYGSDHPVGMGSLSAIYQDLEQLSLSETSKANLKANTAVAFINRFLPGFDWNNRL
jgi:hypothetical protein